MNEILNEIRRLIRESRTMYLPHVKAEALEENGAVYYMNGKNGTEFDWYVNGKVSDFFVFYKDENNLGAVKLTLYRDGGVLVYIYDEHGRNLIKEIKTYVEASTEEIFTFAVLLRNVSNFQQPNVQPVSQQTAAPQSQPVEESIQLGDLGDFEEILSDGEVPF